MLLWYLFLLLPVVAVAWAVWAYRRQAAQKAAASHARMQELLVVGRRQPAPPDSAPVGSPPSQGIAAYMGRERLLGQAETLLFYVLKTGLPDHEIFAGVGLSAVVDLVPGVQGAERETQLRRLAAHRIDFLVCDKSARIVAAVEFGPVAQDAQFRAQCLAAAGIRCVRIDPRAMPRHQDVHALIFGLSH